MGSQYKKLVPCIYLYKGNAVKDLSGRSGKILQR